MPPMKIRLRPTMSPSLPASRRRPPNVSRYAFTTHASDDWEKCSSRWIVGSATFTTVTSSTIMSCPTQSTTSAAQRRRFDAAASPLIEIAVG